MNEKKTNPFAVPAGKTAVLLVPIDVTNRERTLDLLWEEYGKVLEPLPRIIDQVRLSQLTGEYALFIAVAHSTSIERPSKQPTGWRAKVAGPIDTSGFAAQQQAFGLDSPAPQRVSYGGLVDRVQTAIGPSYLCRLAEDDVLTLSAV